MLEAAPYPYEHFSTLDAGTVQDRARTREHAEVSVGSYLYLKQTSLKHSTAAQEKKQILAASQVNSLLPSPLGQLCEPLPSLSWSDIFQEAAQPI